MNNIEINFMNTSVTCRRCRKGHMETVEHFEEFTPPTGTTVGVRQLSARCDVCGKENVLASQVDENIQALAARKASYGEYLLGEEIFAFRRRWGLTQREFSRVFGRGIIAFSRFETETAYPDLTLTRLLKQAMRRPEVFKELADEAGVAVPFWEAHCDAERRFKLRFMQLASGKSAERSRAVMHVTWELETADVIPDTDYLAAA